MVRWILFFSLIVGLLGCGGGGGESLSETAAPTSGEAARSRHIVRSEADASAFLSRATFGATAEEIDALVKLGDYESWLEKQFAAPPSYHMAWVLEHARGVGGVKDLRNDSEAWSDYSDALGRTERDAWWDIAVFGPDQLRQRVAFALSEILVVSREGPLGPFPDTRLSYYDVLVEHAFGNFGKLLRAVTYHPAMGRYLSYLGNDKTDPKVGNRPDENYAREVMQLFSIGLYRLRPDGTPVLENGRPLPTYTQHNVTEMAKVFTGLSDDNGEFPAEASFTTHHGRTAPMAAFENHHDRSAKEILPGVTLPAGGDTRTDIDRALDALFRHPNTAPFVAYRLIQRLVTDNPSPAYVARVAAVFEDNGRGVRGDLGAVVKAILLDEEALEGARTRPERFGKFREPMLYVTHLFRAFHARGGEHTLKQGDTPLYRYRSFNFNGTGYTRQEGALEALTVFNYFTPEDGPYALKKEGLVAPELQLYGKKGIDELLMGLIHRTDPIYRLFEITAELQLTAEAALARDKRYRDLVERLDLILCGGAMREDTKERVADYLRSHHGGTTGGEIIDDEKLVRLAVGLVMTSPDYALQR